MPFILPSIEAEILAETRQLLQKYTRAVTSFSSQFIPMNRIRKENTLKVSHRGLTTQSIPYYNNDELIYFEMELDLHLQSLWIKIGEDERQIPFTNVSESDFYFKIKELLNNLGFSLKVELNTFNDETKNLITSTAVEVILKMLHFADYVFRVFRSELNEITSSLQFRAQPFDVVMHIFCGQPIQSSPMGSDERLGYIMLGFSFGDENNSTPYFYARMSPFPAKLKKRVLPENVTWSGSKDKLLQLSYETVRKSINPIDEIVEFYRWVYNEYTASALKKQA